VSEDEQIGSVFVSNYPPYSFWRSDASWTAEAALDERPRDDAPLGLYLHIPFCRRRCKFCYFRVYVDKDARQIRSYVDALAHEVELLAERRAVAGRPLRFVYFGGGTPSYISVDHLTRLVDRTKAALPWTGAEEVTFECEPGTLTHTKIEALRSLGITRLSLGIENFDDDILRSNGRAHLSQEIARVRPWITAAKFDQLNVDLIAGMVGETWDTWRTSVQKTIDYDPDSVTIYQMELPYNTLFTQDLKEGELAAPLADWPLKREWHQWAIEEMTRAGYEISSAYTMVKRGRGTRFVYRDSVWNGADMLGTGVASFSHMSGIHYQNLDGWDDYLATIADDRLPLSRAFATSRRERLTRETILKLKLGRIHRHEFQTKYGVDVVDAFGPVFDELTAEKMLTVNSGDISLTRRGLLQVDSLLPRFYSSEYQGARYT